MSKRQFAYGDFLPLKATLLFESASHTHPEYDTLRPHMVRLYLEIGMAAKAYELLENLDERAFATPTDFATLKAYALAVRGDYVVARKLLEEAASKLRVQRVVKLLDSAQMLLGSGTLLRLPPPEARGQSKPAGALAVGAEVFRELLPSEGTINLNLALILIEMGETKAAAKAMQAAVDTSPRTPLIVAVAKLYAPYLPGFKPPEPRPLFIPDLDEIALMPDGKPPTWPGPADPKAPPAKTPAPVGDAKPAPVAPKKESKRGG